MLRFLAMWEDYLPKLCHSKWPNLASSMLDFGKLVWQLHHILRLAKSMTCSFRHRGWRSTAWKWPDSLETTQRCTDLGLLDWPRTSLVRKQHSEVKIEHQLQAKKATKINRLFNFLIAHAASPPSPLCGVEFGHNFGKLLAPVKHQFLLMPCYLGVSSR